MVSSKCFDLKWNTYQNDSLDMNFLGSNTKMNLDNNSGDVQLALWLTNPAYQNISNDDLGQECVNKTKNLGGPE